MITLRFKRATTLSVWLFRYVYSDVSALIWLNEREEPVAFELFDTFCGIPKKFSQPPLENVHAVIASNHPQGNMDADSYDLRTLKDAKTRFGYTPALYIICGRQCLKHNAS